MKCLAETASTSASAAHSQATCAGVITVLVFLCAMTLGTMNQVSGTSTNGTDLKLADEDFADELSAIMTELVHNHKSTTNVTVKSVSNDNDTNPIKNETTTTLNSNSASSTTSTTNPTTAKMKRTCACDDSEESLICASNGITYKNTCRFECAKARVNRLRLVKEGRCSQAASAQTYWQSNKSGR